MLLLECFPLFPSAWKTSLRPRLQRSVWYGAHFTHWLPSWEPSFGAHPSPRSWCLPPLCLVCLLPSTSLVGLLLSTHRYLGMTCQQRPFLTLELWQHIFTPIVSFFMCIKDLLIFTWKIHLQRREIQRASVLYFPPPNGHKDQHWANMKPGASLGSPLYRGPSPLDHLLLLCQANTGSWLRSGAARGPAAWPSS